MAAVDLDQLMAFVHKFAGDLGATVAAGSVVIGDRLGLYRALATGGPATGPELAPAGARPPTSAVGRWRSCCWWPGQHQQADR